MDTDIMGTNKYVSFACLTWYQCAPVILSVIFICMVLEPPEVLPLNRTQAQYNDLFSLDSSYWELAITVYYSIYIIVCSTSSILREIFLILFVDRPSPELENGVEHIR